MKICRICGNQLGDPLYFSSNLSITSVRSLSETPLNIYMCHACFHVQKPEIPFSCNYYDRDYRISLESDDFDQLYDKVDGKCIYRTDYQAELLLNFVNIPLKGKILDYGAGKATTLLKLSAIRPDLVPYVFDVSDNYKKYWQVLPVDQQATYTVPEAWKNAFSLIMAHFVLEHVEDPCGFFIRLAGLLSKNGIVFFTVPNLLTNPGDLLAVDHINHFSIASINVALEKAKLSIVKTDKNIFRGAIVCAAKHCVESGCLDCEDYNDYARKIFEIVAFWRNFNGHLDKAIQRYKSAPSAIFGAGVYGSYIAARIRDSVLLKCFLDNSPHLKDSIHMGFPVFAPFEMPVDIEVIYSGLNPSIARDVLAPLLKERNPKIVFFDEGAFAND